MGKNAQEHPQVAFEIHSFIVLGFYVIIFTTGSPPLVRFPLVRIPLVRFLVGKNAQEHPQVAFEIHSFIVLGFYIIIFTISDRPNQNPVLMYCTNLTSVLLF